MIPARMDLSAAMPPVDTLDEATMTVDSRGDAYFCRGIAGGLYSVNNGIEVCSPPMGDFDRDAQVDLTDAVLALKFVAKISSGAFFSPVDVNGSGMIGLLEAIYIIQKASGLRLSSETSKPCLSP